MAFDLENFPTRRAAIEMMAMVSPIYGNSYVMKWIMQVMAKPFSKAEDIVDALILEMFPETCTYTIDYWEMDYHIPHNSNLTLEERRTQLCNKIYYRRPMNPVRICSLIASTTGYPVKMIENTDDNTFEVDILTENAEVSAIRSVINKVKQSHLTCDLCFVSDVSLMLRIGYTPLKIYYRMCGTYPKTAHGLSLGLPDIQISVGDDAVEMNFIPTGTIRSGTFPKPYSKLSLGDINLFSSSEAIPVNAEAASEDVKAGSSPGPSYILESEGSGAGVSASEKIYATEVTYCGEEDY